MSKFGNDLIQSMNEAVAHAKGEGPGTEHALERPRRPETGDGEAQTIRATNDAN